MVAPEHCKVVPMWLSLVLLWQMVDIYTGKGMTREDATLVIETMAKYKDFFVDVMMQQELELQVSRPASFWWDCNSAISDLIWTGTGGRPRSREHAGRRNNVFLFRFLWCHAFAGIRPFPHHVSGA